MAKKGLVLTVLGLFLCATISSNVLAKSEVYFNQPVDKRFAWLNNDAHGKEDFEAKIIELINSAKESIDICTMSFSGVDNITGALVAAANKGIKVRIICDRGYRFKDGVQQVLHGPVQVADNNLPALVCKVNFQKEDRAVPDGFLADYGEEYGDRGNGYTYGWENAIPETNFKEASSSQYTTTLLGNTCVIKNNASKKWKIKLPAGDYYVLANVGQSGYSCKNYIKAQEQNVFDYLNKSLLYTSADNFSCSIVDSDTVSVNVNGDSSGSGNLSITVGGGDEGGYTGLDFIEIYRADNYIKNSKLQHSKYILIDGNTNNATLWTGSGNLTPGMKNLSEDAFLTDEKDICNAFYEEFNYMWGGETLVPNSTQSKFGTLKPEMSTETYSILNSSLPVPNSFDWKVHFSPSKASVNLYEDLSNFIKNSNHNLIMLMEQWSNGSDPKKLVTNELKSHINNGKKFYGLFGNKDEDANFLIFTSFEDSEKVKIRRKPNYIHNKIALSDAYRDTRYAKRGSVLFGSMNWSTGGMHENDEQTLIVNDPAIANQYLQRAMAALKEEGITPPSDTDIVLVLDRSYSMVTKCTNSDQSKLTAMKNAAKLFVDLLATDGKHRMSVVRFGATVENNKYADTEVLKTLTSQYADTIKNEIDSISITSSEKISDGTCYGLALQSAFSRFDEESNNKRKMVILFTDGLENRSPTASTVYPQLLTGNNNDVEIHSIAFGNFDSSARPVLSDMAIASVGTFAQIISDEVPLKKRFAEIAGDVMDSSVILDPEYKLTNKALSVNFDIAEAVDSFQVLQLNNSESFVPEMKISVDKQKDIVAVEHQNQNSGYQIFDFKELPQIKESLPKMELKANQKVNKKYKEKVSLVILAKAPTTMKAEVVADKAGQKEVTLLCRMLQNNDAITDAKMTAEWTTPISSKNSKTTKVKLYDDGKHGDGQAKDGLFGAKLTLNEAGNHSFHITAISSKDRRIELIKEKITAKKTKKALTPKVRRETTVYYMVNK